MAVNREDTGQIEADDISEDHRGNQKATKQQANFEFVEFPVGKSCVPKDGYMDVPISGKRDNVDHCEELCSKDTRCNSFTFFRNIHCSMFTHSCDNVKDARNAISKKKVFV